MVLCKQPATILPTNPLALTASCQSNTCCQASPCLPRTTRSGAHPRQATTQESLCNAQCTAHKIQSTGETPPLTDGTHVVSHDNNMSNTLSSWLRMSHFLSSSLGFFGQGLGGASAKQHPSQQTASRCNPTPRHLDSSATAPTHLLGPRSLRERTVLRTQPAP